MKYPFSKRGGHVALKVIIGIIAGIAAFYFASRVCVYIDHTHDATTGPYRYYGFPLPFNISSPDMGTLAAFYAMKLQRVVFNILFWCCASWAILFLPQICRAFKANARRLAKPLIVAAIIIAALVIVSYIYRDAIGYHWYWGDCKFWEYRRYINPPNFPWWQWVLINL